MNKAKGYQNVALELLKSMIKMEIAEQKLLQASELKMVQQ